MFRDFRVGRGFQVDPDNTLTSGLLSYFKFEDNTNDFWNTRNGTDTSVSYVTGKVGKAGSYNGSSSKTNLVDTGFPTGSAAMSVSCWVYTATDPSAWSDAQTVFSYGTASNTQARAFQIHSASGNFQSRIDIYGSDQRRSNTTAIAQNTWYHLVWTYAAAANTHAFYINNSDTSSSTFTATPSTVLSSAGIGYRRPANDAYAGLYIDELAVYNRVLTADEIADLYNGGSGQTIVSSGYCRSSLTNGLKAYYRLEDVTESFVGDGTLDLTNNNTVVFTTGKVGDGGDFEEDSTQTLSTTNTLGIDGGTFSWAGWIKVETAPASNTVNGIFAQGINSSSKVGYWASYFNDAGTLKIFFDRAKYGVGEQFVNVAQTFTIGTWYHLVCTYNGTQLEVFVNNSSVGTAAASGSGSTTLFEGFRLGADGEGPTGRCWDGLIDECGVWGRALSIREIEDLYNSGNGQTISDIADHSREANASLPSNDTNLSTAFSFQEYDDVCRDDAVYVNQAATGEKGIFLFKDYHTNGTDGITLHWNGQTSLAPSTSPVRLQIYNRTSTTWETLDTDSTTGADTDFSLDGTKSSGLSNYYDGNNMISARVYQSDT